MPPIYSSVKIQSHYIFVPCISEDQEPSLKIETQISENSESPEIHETKSKKPSLKIEAQRATVNSVNELIDNVIGIVKECKNDCNKTSERLENIKLQVTDLLKGKFYVLDSGYFSKFCIS